MLQQSKSRLLRLGFVRGRKTRLLCLSLLLAFATQTSLRAFQTKIDNIQQYVELVKKSLYCEDADYHTDGQRTVWVKSYKKWTPNDFTILQKEAPDVLRFLEQAAAHNRLDVLGQLLPNYYRTHGGVQAFAADIKRENIK